MIENQHVEFKQVWKDDFLRSICAFANAQGGKLYLGLDDQGKVVGLKNYSKLLKDLPNKIRDILGLIPQINHKKGEDMDYIEIHVPPSKTPVSYHGHFYYRSGSTIQDLSGGNLEHFLLAKRGKKWDGRIADQFTMQDLSENAFRIFREKAVKSKRIPDEDLSGNNESLLELLKLSSNKQLLRAAVLCFGNDAEKLITGAFVKVGFFRSHSDLLFQDLIEGSLIEQVEKTMDLLTTKYMKANIAYEGITRIETYEYPVEALREAVLNAIIHKDYSSNVPVQISVYDRWLMIYNSGRLPEGWTLDTLKQKHSSIPANPDIARIFFRAGYIENWGRGISDMIKYCINAGLPEPFYRKMGAGYVLIFEQEKGAADFLYAYGKEEAIHGKDPIKDPIKDPLKDPLKQLSENEFNIISLMKRDPKITISRLSDSVGINERNIKKNIEKLKLKGIIKRTGSKKSGSWEVL